MTTSHQLDFSNEAPKERIQVMIFLKKLLNRKNMRNDITQYVPK